MLHQPIHKLLLFCTCSLLLVSCGSPTRKVETKPASAVAGVTGDAQERAAAYAERLRLGLGSPFRLIEIALNDERLGDTRAVVARNLFAQIERGALYEVSPRALMAAGMSESSAIAQLELMERAITSANDARAGELAVILAYELAAAERIATPTQVARTARVAALLRDRELARADAQHLREAARRAHVTPANLVVAWRAQRRFAVEQPTLAPLDASTQADAARLALLLIGGIRSAMTPVASVMQRTVAGATAGLTPEIARTLLADPIGVEQSALLITMRALRPAATVSHGRLSASNWQDFFAHASGEERFVAALSLVRQDPADDVVATGIALDAAVALRPFAQEHVSIDTLSAQQLLKRFGVRVRFDARVPAAQREDALRMLTSALTDLRSVIRNLDVTGLTFVIGPIDPAAPHLAFHDPRKRVIRLDPATMAGTIAHEIAHDLDWQLAARKYRTRSNYATDFATKNRRALAYTVENLGGADAKMTQPTNDDAASRRPAEMFARRFEWYVASALALRGRSNGFLSSAQNDWIRGYGSAIRPDASAAAAQSFAALVAEATNMDRTELAAVERTVIESAPIVVRVLARAAAAPNRLQMRKQTLAELRDWECANAWPGGPGDEVGIRWFLDALNAATFRPIGSAAAQPMNDIVTLEPVRAADPGDQMGLHLAGCNPLTGVFLAQSMR